MVSGRFEQVIRATGVERGQEIFKRIREEIQRTKNPNTFSDRKTSLTAELFSEIGLTDLNNCLTELLETIIVWLEHDGDVNLQFDTIEIHGDCFQNIACWQIAYIVWKQVAEMEKLGLYGYTLEDVALAETIFITIFEHPTVRLSTTFTEESIDSNFAGTCYPYEQAALLDECTLAHYAMARGDLDTVHLMLNRASYLMHDRCSWVFNAQYIANAGEGDITQDRGKWDLGVIVAYEEGFNLTRVWNISLAHLAAESANTHALTYLLGRGFDIYSDKDSDGVKPKTHFALQLREYPDCVSKGDIAQADFVFRKVNHIWRDFLPSPSVTLINDGYAVEYDLRLRLPVCVRKDHYPHRYQAERTTDSRTFTEDKRIPRIFQGNNPAYTHSGYERGHNAAAADAMTQREWDATFLFTNCMPQTKALNNGPWKSLEARVRRWVEEGNFARVFSGPILKGEREKITYSLLGDREVAVPSHYFKIVLYYTKRRWRRACYIFPNSKEKMTYNHEDPKYKSSLEEIQKCASLLLEDRIKEMTQSLPAPDAKRSIEFL